jgi:cytochrome c553
MTQDELDDPSSGKLRHYAIPSTERCDQCHMGSHSKSYILGFTPFHADRRKAGEGGIFEDPHEGEVDQLARLIEYGVVKGIEPGQAKLEASQGGRSPRNDYELTAQGYMMGNCSFCHNPNGFPTVQNPILAPFDLYPSETGGIFQFPLEKYSERAKFGPNQQTRFPYITPAFGNHPYGTAPTTSKQYPFAALSPVIDVVPGVNIAGFPIWVNEGAPDVLYDRFNFDPTGNPLPPEFIFLGPWRSLIWRNVYTPFTYSEDGAIFIHMPRNVPGFDCRAQMIMAEWMLSIPAKDCAGLQGLPAQVCEGKQAAMGPDDTGYNLDQPYEEVLPSGEGYTLALRDAENRVEAYRNSVTGQHCPSDTDIVDAQVILSPKLLGLERKEYPSPQDQTAVPPNGPRVTKDPNAWSGKSDGVPDHAHWVPIDTTDDFSQGWTPRRSNWQAVLADRSVPVSPQLNAVIDELQNLHVTDAQKSFSETPVPMGLWHPNCWGSAQAASSPTVAELQLKALQRTADQLSDLELWTLEKDYSGSPLPLFAPVHEQSRGQAVFRAICQNCHGRDADSRSPLATTIGELTGAETRVANFVDGLLGPKPAPGVFAEDEFRINRGATPADWQVRYMLFMGLGGTEAAIPEIAVSLVKTSPFYGVAVAAGEAGGANMLEAASGKCARLLASTWRVAQGGLKVTRKEKTFLAGTGEYELWESVCGFQNEPVVRVLRPTEAINVLFESFSPVLYRSKDDSGAWVYPSDHPVGNRLGKMQLGIQPDNFLPWCVIPTVEHPLDELKQLFASEGVPDSLMPFCPEVLFATAFGGKEIHQLQGLTPSLDNTAVMSRITRRGAMNAGMAAYYYLDGFTKGTFTPSPAYDECKAVP